MMRLTRLSLSHGLVRMVCFMFMFVVPVTPLLAATPSKLLTFGELFATSYIINGAIAGLSVLGLMLFAYFLFTINLSTFLPAAFLGDVSKLVVSRRYDQAAQLCRTHRGVVASSILQRGLENIHRDHATLISIIDSEGKRRTEIWWTRIGYLSDIAAVAPMLGLLGTVWGMIQAFYVLPDQTTSINSRALTQAIGGAMSTTLFGLIVAIACVIFYSLIKSRLTRTLSELEHQIHALIDQVKSDLPSSSEDSISVSASSAVAPLASSSATVKTGKGPLAARIEAGLTSGGQP